MMNAAVYAMKMFQKGMEGQAEKVGLDTEDAIDKLVAEVRGEVVSPEKLHFSRGIKQTYKLL